MGARARRRDPHPRHPHPPPRRAPGRHARGLADRVRLLRGQLRPRVRDPAPADPAPRRLRDRARARRRRDGPRLVRGRQGAGQGTHLHGLHRRGRLAGRLRVGGARPPGRGGPQRRRPPHGRGHQRRPRPLPRDPGGRALRGCAVDDPGPVPAAHRRRVGGVGQSADLARRVRRDEPLHAV